MAILLATTKLRGACVNLVNFMGFIVVSVVTLAIAEILGDPYYNKIPIPRITYTREPGLPLSAAAASTISVEYPQQIPTPK